MRKNVKRILEVIVGLLKDRMTVSDEPASKWKKKSRKNNYRSDMYHGLVPILCIYFVCINNASFTFAT